MAAFIRNEAATPYQEPSIKAVDGSSEQGRIMSCQHQRDCHRPAEKQNEKRPSRRPHNCACREEKKQGESKKFHPDYDPDFHWHINLLLLRPFLGSPRKINLKKLTAIMSIDLWNV
jgi:hypothetical protein